MTEARIDGPSTIYCRIAGGDLSPSQKTDCFLEMLATLIVKLEHYQGYCSRCRSWFCLI
jgi:hypothetical protein